MSMSATDPAPVKAVEPVESLLGLRFRQFMAAAALLAAVGVLLGLGQFGLHKWLTRDDVREIKAVVEAAHLLRGRACTLDYRDDAAAIRAQLANYWSSAPREAAEVAQRQALADKRGGFSESWAEETPLETREAALADCLAKLSEQVGTAKAFGLDRLSFQGIAVSDEGAEALVRVDQWYEYARKEGGADRARETRGYRYRLRKEAGFWKLLEASSVGRYD